MPTALRRSVLVLVLFGLAVGPLFSQANAGANPFGISMNLGIGVQSFDEGGVQTTYQSLSLAPDIGIGPFGVGLAITLNYRFTGGANGNGQEFQVREADWVPTSFQSFLQIYLPKISYIRYGEKGQPLFLKFGSFEDGTLGDGFIVGNYSNTMFLPTDRHFGLAADLDGSLFKFPYVGVETFVGNLALLDLLGGRLYVRPLVSTSIPILKDIEFGFTGAVDTKPYAYTMGAYTPKPIGVFGADIRLPLIYVKDTATMVAFTDLASIDGQSTGGMLGIGGKLFNFVTYGAQLRILGADFIANYFGATYDLFKSTQFDLIQKGGFSSASAGYFASIGTSFLNDKIVFNVGLDGPFSSTATDPLVKYPHLRGILSLADGVVPGISFNFTYDKKGIDTFASLISPENADINAQLNFQSGAAVISFVYTITYSPTHTPDPWIVNSGLQSSIKLF
jgi:hypothetical protein